jgi:hypothetical protein
MELVKLWLGSSPFAVEKELNDIFGLFNIWPLRVEYPADVNELIPT